MKTKTIILTSLLASLSSAAVFADTNGCVIFVNNTNSVLSISYLANRELSSTADGHNINAGNTSLLPGAKSQAIYLQAWGSAHSTGTFKTTYQTNKPIVGQIKIGVNNGDAPSLQAAGYNNFIYTQNKSSKSSTCYDVSGSPRKGENTTVFGIKLNS